MKTIILMILLSVPLNATEVYYEATKYPPGAEKIKVMEFKDKDKTIGEIFLVNGKVYFEGAIHASAEAFFSEVYGDYLKQFCKDVEEK